MMTNGQSERTESPRTIAHLFFGRRKQDIDLTLKMVLSVIGILLFVGSCTAGAAALLGIRLTGVPSEVLKAQDELTTLAAKSDRNFVELKETYAISQDSILSLAARVARVEQAMILLAYTQCVQLRKSDPDLLPPECSQTIRDQQARRRRP